MNVILLRNCPSSEGEAERGVDGEREREGRESMTIDDRGALLIRTIFFRAVIRRISVCFFNASHVNRERKCTENYNKLHNISLKLHSAFW